MLKIWRSGCADHSGKGRKRVWEELKLYNATLPEMIEKTPVLSLREAQEKIFKHSGTGYAWIKRFKSGRRKRNLLDNKRRNRFGLCFYLRISD